MRILSFEGIVALAIVVFGIIDCFMGYLIKKNYSGDYGHVYYDFQRRYNSTILILFKILFILFLLYGVFYQVGFGKAPLVGMMYCLIVLTALIDLPFHKRNNRTKLYVKRNGNRTSTKKQFKF